MLVVAVIGSKKSGKTTTIEALVRGLTKRGYRVATVKHVSEKGFTIDTGGKDTWRHAQAGAQTIVAVASKELAVIKKVDTTRLSLQEIVKNCQDNIDIIILEGFKRLVEHEPTIPKIVTVRTFNEAAEKAKRFKPIIAFIGSAALDGKSLGIPVMNILEDPEKLVKIVERNIKTL